MTDKDSASLVLKANSDLHNFYNWVTANKLTINTDKTVAMIFSTRKVTNIPLVFIKDNMSHVNIKYVDHTKFLGVHYDKNLNFKHHINTLSSKLSKIAGMFYSLHTILPTKILKLIYYCHIRSILEFGVPV